MLVPNRPFAVTCLIGLVLTLTGLQALKLWGILTSWETLSSLPLSIPPMLFGLSATVWVAIGIGLLWGLWRVMPWAPRATRWAAVALLAVHWLDRLLLQTKGSQSTNWLFDIVLSIALLASVISILALPQARDNFGESHE